MMMDTIKIKLPKRKSPRLKGFNYNTSGYYFITICTYNKAKTLCRVGAIHESPLQMRSAVDKTVGYIEMNVSKRIHQEISKEIVWQRSYHDHIIRDEKDYLKIWQYIDTNPIKWEYDCFYSKT